jgi:hypothetical protein
MRKCIIALGLIALLSVTAGAAPTVVTSQAEKIVVKDTEGTMAFDAAGSEKLVVGVMMESGPSVNGISYAGTDLEPLQAFEWDSKWGNLWLYQLNAPATGSNDIKVSLAGDKAGYIVAAFGLSGAGESAVEILSVGLDDGPNNEDPQPTEVSVAHSTLAYDGVIISILQTDGENVADPENTMAYSVSGTSMRGMGDVTYASAGETPALTWALVDAEGNPAPTRRIGVVSAVFVPEPATMSLLALGGLVALKRRRSC